jgi:hypothetical protein
MNTRGLSDDVSAAEVYIVVRKGRVDDTVMDRVILREARYCDGDPGGSGG